MWMICLLFAIHPDPLQSAETLVGQWTHEEMDGLSIYFETNGSFWVDGDGDKKPEVSGQFVLADGKLIMNDTGGKNACEANGVYIIKRKSNKITFKKVQDPCIGRSTLLHKQTWTLR